jgi:hypothetical protein
MPKLRRSLRSKTVESCGTFLDDINSRNVKKGKHMSKENFVSKPFFSCLKGISLSRCFDLLEMNFLRIIVAAYLSAMSSIRLPC